MELVDDEVVGSVVSVDEVGLVVFVVDELLVELVDDVGAVVVVTSSLP